MKRDLDFLREILLFAETHCDGSAFEPLDVSKLPVQYLSATQATIDEHITLAQEQGLIDAIHPSNGWHIRRLTWDGQEFLANAREPEVWNAAKAAVGSASFAVFVSTLSHLAVHHGLDSLKSWLEATLARLGGS